MPNGFAGGGTGGGTLTSVWKRKSNVTEKQHDIQTGGVPAREMCWAVALKEGKRGEKGAQERRRKKTPDGVKREGQTVWKFIRRSRSATEGRNKVGNNSGRGRTD